MAEPVQRSDLLIVAATLAAVGAGGLLFVVGSSRVTQKPAIVITLPKWKPVVTPPPKVKPVAAPRMKLPPQGPRTPRETVAPPEKKEVVIPRMRVPPPIMQPEKKRKKKRAERAERPKLKRVAGQQRKPTANECARMKSAGRQAVILGGAGFGYSTAQVERALRDCGL